MPTTFQPESISDVQLAVRSSSKLCIAGNGTKRLDYLDALESDRLDMTRIAGIIEYDPSEFTITASAGTRLDVLRDALAERGQFMPFDPPLIEGGATLGGMIAAGISGPSRLRFGGIRDFVLRVQYVDGTGAVAVAGGKVVKNAAGFDIPKLMVGSWGELGVLLEITLKVFPRPIEYASARIDAGELPNAIALMHRLVRSPLDLDALDVEDSRFLLIRLGGFPEAIAAGVERVEAFSREIGSASLDVSRIASTDELGLWSPLLDWTWCDEDASLIRIPLTSAKMIACERALSLSTARCRYSLAGNLAWIDWPSSAAIDDLDRLMKDIELTGRIVRGRSIRTCQIGKRPSQHFAGRIRHAMDPDNRFMKRS